PSPHDVGVCQQIDMRCAPLRHFVRFQCQLPIGAATVISRKAIRWTKPTPGDWCPRVIDKEAIPTPLLGKFLLKFLSLVSRHPVKLPRRTTVECTPAATPYALVLPEEKEHRFTCREVEDLQDVQHFDGCREVRAIGCIFFTPLGPN